MGYGAIKNNKNKNVKSARQRRTKEMKQTCLSSDSIIASFCLICAKRYSRLLMTGEKSKSDDGVGEEQREGKGEAEGVDVIDGDEGTCIIASGMS